MSINCTGTATGASFPTVGSIVVPKPPAATAGNLLVVAIGCQADFVAGTGWPTSSQTGTPAGWTLAGHQEQYGSPNPGLVIDVFYKFLQVGETEWTFPIVNRRTYPILYAISAWNGVDQATPIDVAASLSINTPAATTSVAPSRTTTTNNAILLCHYLIPVETGFVTPTFSTPTGMTARGYVAHDTNGGSLGAFSQSIAAPGATGTRTTTLSGGASLESIATSIAIRSDQSQPTAEPDGFTVAVGFGVPSILMETPPEPIDDLLEDVGAGLLRTVVRVKPYDRTAEAEMPAYFIDQLGSPRDLPAGIRERLRSGVSVERSIFADDALGGEGTTSVGSLTLLNGDGALDAFNSDYAFDHRDFDAWLGGITPAGEELAWADYRKVVSAKTAGATAQLDDATIDLADRGAIFDRLVQTTRYAGTGGAEGGDDLVGKVKPIGLGTVRNAEPQLLSKVPLLYQFHDGDTGAATSLDAVYDSGIELSTSLYTVDLSAGTFTLLTNPAGRITCDFQGPVAAGTRAAAFVKWLVSTVGVGPLTYPNDFVADFFIAYEGSQLAELGLYLRDETSIRDALNTVVAPLGYWTLSRLGKLIVGTIEVPFGQYDLDIQPWEVRSITPRKTAKPYCRVSVGWGRNWTQQDRGELAGAAVATDQGLFAVEEYRVSQYPVDGRDATVLAAFPTAEERPLIQTLFVNKADADAAAEAYFGIYGKPWLVFDVELSLRALSSDLGKVQRLTYYQPTTDADGVSTTLDRFGLSRGVLLRTLAEKVELGGESSGMTLTLWATTLPVMMVFDDTYSMAFDTDEWMQF